MKALIICIAVALLSFTFIDIKGQAPVFQLQDPGQVLCLSTESVSALDDLRERIPIDYAGLREGQPDSDYGQQRQKIGGHGSGSFRHQWGL